MPNVKPFYCQESADAGDNPYFPEFLYPDDREGWKWVNLDGHWFTYFIFNDRSRRPLYVGRTSNIYRRLAEHTQKVWWPLVDKIIVDCHESVEESVEAEARRIASYQPMFNKVRPKGATF